MSEEEPQGEARGGVWYAWCDTEGKKIGPAQTVRADAEADAEKHSRNTDHTTSIITM